MSYTYCTCTYRVYSMVELVDLFEVCLAGIIQFDAVRQQWRFSHILLWISEALLTWHNRFLSKLCSEAFCRSLDVISFCRCIRRIQEKWTKPLYIQTVDHGTKMFEQHDETTERQKEEGRKISQKWSSPWFWEQSQCFLLFPSLHRKLMCHFKTFCLYIFLLSERTLGYQVCVHQSVARLWSFMPFLAEDVHCRWAEPHDQLTERTQFSFVCGCVMVERSLLALICLLNWIALPWILIKRGYWSISGPHRLCVELLFLLSVFTRQFARFQLVVNPIFSSLVFIHITTTVYIKIGSFMDLNICSQVQVL